MRVISVYEYRQGFPFFAIHLGIALMIFSLVFSDFRVKNLLYAAIPDSVSSAVDEGWNPLLAKLKKDGFYGQDIETWFASLANPYSQKPMGQKINALFRARFIYPPFAFLRKPQKAPELLHDVMTRESIAKSAEFIKENSKLLAALEHEYNVEKEIVVALFMVETRLGTYIGTEQAFWSLACMALADTPELVQSYLDKLPVTPERMAWVKEKLEARSDWAYKELKALIEYCRQNKHNPLEIIGSPFGAIGLCQFMPSNIAMYAADGDKDGRIDLFAVGDALPSIANFLKKHNWKNSMNRKQRHSVVRHYNHSDAYANTVLALADGIRAYLKNTLKKNGAK